MRDHFAHVDVRFVCGLGASTGGDDRLAHKGMKSA